MSDFDLNAFLPYQLAVAAAHVSRGFAELYRAEFGLSIPEWRVLAHLAQSGTVSVREIQAAARLEAAGLIEKRAHGTDRRLLDMSLTPQGRALFARIVPIAKAYEAGVLARLADAGAFRGALKAVTGGEIPEN